LLLLVMLLGCSKQDESATRPQPIPAPLAKLARQVLPRALPVQKQLSSAAKTGSPMDFRHRTDPFKAFATAVVAAPPPHGAPASRHSLDLLPIQSSEVGKFKVVGIITGLKENRALLIDPGGKGYVVHVGTPLGPNDGMITRITAETVEVVERFKEDSGRYRKRKIVLALAKKR
jgi:type IV pilus assembly protein PilP